MLRKHLFKIYETAKALGILNFTGDRMCGVNAIMGV